MAVSALDAIMNAMTAQSPASQMSLRLAKRAHRVADRLERLTDTFDSRNRDFDEALHLPDDQPMGRDYPGPEAGCGHVRLLK